MRKYSSYLRWLVHLHSGFLNKIRGIAEFEQREKENHSNRFHAPLPKLASYLWHSDITFEHIPADYGVLKMAEMPNDVGGDTLFACAYEMYDRMSPHYKKMCDGLTATHYQVNLNKTFATLHLLTDD